MRNWVILKKGGRVLVVFKVVALAVFLPFGLEPKDAKAAIAVDAVSTGPLSNAVTSLTFSHTVGASGTNRLLVIGLSIRHDASNYTVSVTYAGMPMSPSGSISRNEALSEIWYLESPLTGSNNVVLKFPAPLLFSLCLVF